LPIPFDNFLPAWAILFFCLALLERDGAMAMLGWVFTLLTAAWTAFLLVVGPYVVSQLVKSLF
ncbi:MAG: exopolysaccharide biosynthesis protein, partial [Pseudomonadota bacterium]